MQEEHSRAGTVRIRPALTWGWAAATSNWRLWVPCTAVALLITAASLALCYYVTPLVVAALVIPFATVTALRQTRERAPPRISRKAEQNSLFSVFRIESLFF